MKNTWTGFTTLMIVAATAGYSRATSLSVTNGLAFHLTAICGALNASGNPATDGVDVQTWKDQSPNGRDFTPTFSTRRPTFQAGASANGMPGLYYDGSADILRCQGITAEIRSLFIVMKPETAVAAGSTSRYLMNCSPSVYRETLELGENSGGFASELVMIRSMNSSGNVHRSAYTSPTAALSGTTRLAVVFNSTDGAWDIYKDGISVRNTVTGTQDDNGYVLTNNTFTLGARSVDNNVFQGHLFEVIAYTNSLSGADVQSVDAYLNKLYVQTAREITVSSTGKGSVSPSGTVATEIGATETFEIAARPGHHIGDIKVNGASVRESLGLNPKSHTYVWTPVVDDGTLEVTFLEDETELKPTSGLAFWYDARSGVLDDLGLRAEPGMYVKTWRDRSTNALDVSCGTTYGVDGRSPLLQADASPNGSAGLYFDGANDTFWSAAVTASVSTLVVAFAPAAPITAATTTPQVLFNARGRYAENLTLGAYTTSYANEYFGIRSYNAAESPMQAAYVDASGVIDGFTVITAVHDAQAKRWRLYRDGNGIGSVSGVDENGFVLTGHSIFLASADQNDRFNGHLFEVVGYSAELSAADRYSVESYLKYKYAQEPVPSGTLLSIR